jgi:polyphosphate:AMP phosphotransferase
MLEEFETGLSIEKAHYEAQVPKLRADLLNAQYDLRRAHFSVLVLIAGDDRLGINALVKRLHEWMDARYLVTRGFGLPTDEERQRPVAWRYWRELPPRGQIGLYINGWAYNAIASRVLDQVDEREFERSIEHSNRMEQALADDGTLVLKYWLHVPQARFEERLAAARKKKQVDARDELLLAVYDAAVPVAERWLEGSSEPLPWTVVESGYARYRDLTVARSILDAVTERLERPAPAPAPPAPSIRGRARRSALAEVDLSTELARDEYRERLDACQRDILKRQARLLEAGTSTLLVFEGWDAAGKGGAIRRVTRPLDVRDYRIIPSGAPSAEEQRYHHLWRFWQRMTRGGTLLVFDRSWYGRVLVERVEGFASEAEWSRAYDEINDFEAQLVEHGCALCKFWLHIDREQQLERFQARERTPYKKYKITNEDYRNRDRWDAYEAAVDDMVERTSTKSAPWTLVSANDKRWARVQVLETVSAAMKRALKND